MLASTPRRPDSCSKVYTAGGCGGGHKGARCVVHVPILDTGTPRTTPPSPEFHRIDSCRPMGVKPLLVVGRALREILVLGEADSEVAS